MASVTSLDKDMRQLRMDRYTPQAAKEVRTFIEEALGEALQQADLVDSLKDGVALCKLVNLAAPGSLKFKTRAVMPFVQMENISLFLQACQLPPFNLQSHDIFLTVDLFESKDPAQVLQCLGAFSRAAHRLSPANFPSPIGGKSRGGPLSPQRTGGAVGGGSYGTRGRGNSNASNGSSTYNPAIGAPSALTPRKTGDSNSGKWSPTKTSGKPLSPGVSSWSKKSDEGATSPAWNIAQYGYMGGASQGNLGVSFGGRRQITSAGPKVPNVAEKLRLRKEKEAEEARMRLEAEEAERDRERQEIELERARLDAEAEKNRKAYELEAQRLAEEKRKWEESEKRWEVENKKRQEEERVQMEALRRARADSDEAKRRARENDDDEREALRRGQSIDLYRAEKNGVQGSELDRIRELERQLHEAHERERRYQIQRQAKANKQHQALEDHDIALRMKEEPPKGRTRSRSRPRAPSHKDSDEEWRKDEREYLRAQWNASHSGEDHNLPQSKSPRPLPQPTSTPPARLVKSHTGSRPLPQPTPPARLVKEHTGSRPLPDPAKYASSKPSTPKPNPFSQSQNRTDRYLSANPAPEQEAPRTTYSNEIATFDSSAERDAEDRRRAASQIKTKAGGWASKSLLEREMELERQRQQEWEEGQMAMRSKGPSGPRPLPSR